MDRDVAQAAVSQFGRLAEVYAHPPRAVLRALDRLMRASQYARESGHSDWEFAITMAELRRDGVSESELRWLACREFVQHGKETTRGSGDRTFDRQVSLRLSKRSAFVITDAGIVFRNSLADSENAQEIGFEVYSARVPKQTEPSPSTVSLNPRRSVSFGTQPVWDRDRRELRLGGELVKVFKLPSPMQETILMAFEEEHWPPRIDDPLPTHPEMLPKRRLHDTIKSLNRNQKNALVRFMGDGTGEGVRWELAMSGANAGPSISLLG